MITNKKIIALKKEMDKIFNSFKESNQHPYEIYSLMSVVALNEDVEYSVALHNKLMVL